MLSRPSDTGHTPFEISLSQSPDLVYWENIGMLWELGIAGGKI